MTIQARTIPFYLSPPTLPHHHSQPKLPQPYMHTSLRNRTVLFAYVSPHLLSCPPRPPLASGGVILCIQVRDIESDLRKLGMEVEEGVGGQSVMDMRKVEGRELATRALGIATVLVLVAAALAAYLFHLYTGVKSVREFRDWWRRVIREQVVRA